jgi:hypothetical protein
MGEIFEKVRIKIWNGNKRYELIESYYRRR